MAINNYGVVNTKHKYGYGYRPKYAKVSEIVNDSLNVITEAQWCMIRDIEKHLNYEFSGTKADAHKFIADHIEELKLYRKGYGSELTPEDRKLFKRGVSREDISLIRQIEKSTGMSFSERSQNRGEAYKFIEEYRCCLA